MQLMRNFRAYVGRGAGDESGQALIEYALIVGLIAVVAVVALALTGTDLSGLLNTVAGQL